MLALVSASSMMYHSMFIRKQNELSRIQPLVCFVLSLRYCLAMLKEIPSSACVYPKPLHLDMEHVKINSMMSSFPDNFLEFIL